MSLLRQEVLHSVADSRMASLMPAEPPVNRSLVCLLRLSVKNNRIPDHQNNRSVWIQLASLRGKLPIISGGIKIDGDLLESLPQR
jgi:hypothetical protein